MKKAYIVIGANYGDEGKGLITDYIADREIKAGRSVLVCRFNGGAQAGHTVTTPEGKRHVFSHFGSGTLVGAGTYLSTDFITNPLLWINEYRALHRLGINVDDIPFYAASGSKLTTPFDMLLNRAAEISRGEGRHGSCGVGINETVTRYENFSIIDCEAESYLKYLKMIQNEYVPRRLDELDVDIDDPLLAETMGYMKSETIIDMFMEAHGYFSNHLWNSGGFAYPTSSVDVVIFEGAQGLMLDEVNGYFPYVTRSRTGLTNIVNEYFYALHKIPVETIYVTRTYLTRHGQGPMKTEDASLSFVDETNVPNEWQGSLRFGYLDLDEMSTFISRDLANSGMPRDQLNPKIALTWFKSDEMIKVMIGGELVSVSHRELPAIIRAATGIEIDLISTGKTRNDVMSSKEELVV